MVPFFPLLFIFVLAVVAPVRLMLANLLHFLDAEKRIGLGQ